MRIRILNSIYLIVLELRRLQGVFQSRPEVANGKSAWWEMIRGRVSDLQAEFLAWVGSIRESVEAAGRRWLLVSWGSGSLRKMWHRHSCLCLFIPKIFSAQARVPVPQKLSAPWHGRPARNSDVMKITEKTTELCYVDAAAQNGPRNANSLKNRAISWVEA